MTYYIVSLFDDSVDGKRREIGLNTNKGMVFITNDLEKANEAFENELAWMRENCKAYNFRMKGDPAGVSVNISKSYGLQDGQMRWSWYKQSHCDYIL